MKVVNWNNNTTLNTSDYTTVYSLSQTNTSYFHGFVMHLDDNNMLLQVYCNGELYINADLSEWSDPNKFDLDSAGIDAIRQYQNNRWAIMFPKTVIVSTIDIKLKHKSSNAKKMLRGFSIILDW